MISRPSREVFMPFRIKGSIFKEEIRMIIFSEVEDVVLVSQIKVRFLNRFKRYGPVVLTLILSYVNELTVLIKKKSGIFSFPKS